MFLVHWALQLALVSARVEFGFDMQVRVPEGMSMEQLDVIKLTAQFVARNGKQFLAG